jgi:hypothetical protein
MSMIGMMMIYLVRLDYMPVALRCRGSKVSPCMMGMMDEMHRVCLLIICRAYGKHECREVHDRYDVCDWGRGSLKNGV